MEQIDIIGNSAPMLKVLDQVSRLAQINKPVIIIGERGTGKELIAARLHFLSKRWGQSFVKLNCATLSDALLESELFGHEIGSFTGANKLHVGRFERADGGSLFLDELANTSSLVQEKLLQVIEYGEFERVGGQKTIKTDVRLFCATNEDLPSLVAKNKFRADLLDRLSFAVITLPPLRVRGDDILILANHFAINMIKQLGLEFFAGFSKDAENKLRSYNWPGNIRELKNVIERSVYLNDTNANKPLDLILFDPWDSPYRLIDNKEKGDDIKFPLDLKQVLQDNEVKLLKQAFVLGQYKQAEVAKLLNISYHQLRALLKKYPDVNS